MTYATRANMEDRFGEAEVECWPAGKVEAVLADAAVEIDSRIGARYALPLDAAAAGSPLLTRIACDLARYFAWEDAASDRVIEAAKDARKMLDAIAKGTMTLPGQEGPPADELARQELARRTGPEPAMTPQALEGL